MVIEQTLVGHILMHNLNGMDTYREEPPREGGKQEDLSREGINNQLREKCLEEDLWIDRDQWRQKIGRSRRTF